MNKKAIGKIFMAIEKEHDDAYEIYEYNTKELKLNPYNGRFRAEAHDAKNGVELISSLDALSETEKAEFIKMQNLSGIKVLTKSIESENQNDPLVITKDGIVVDGNRRLVVLRGLGIEKAKVIILKGNYSTLQELEMLETIIQFKKLEKEKYTTLNKEIKISNMFAQFDENVSHEARYKEIMNITGETKTVIISAIEKEKFMNESMTLWDTEFKYKWFEKTSEQVKNVLTFVSKTFNSRKDIGLNWYKGDEASLNNFLKSSAVMVLTKPRAVGGTRELFKVGTTNLATDKDIFAKYLEFYNKDKLSKIIKAIKENDKASMKALANLSNEFNARLRTEIIKLRMEKIKQISKQDTKVESGSDLVVSESISRIKKTNVVANSNVNKAILRSINLFVARLNVGNITEIDKKEISNIIDKLNKLI